MNREFAVSPPGKAAWLFILGLAAGLPLFVLLLITALEGTRTAGLPILMALPIVGLVAGILVLGMRRRGVHLNDERLEVKAAFYTQRIPLAELDAANAKVFNLAKSGSFRKPGPHWPLLKTNGFSAPGFLAGHFRSRGSDKHFVLLTQREKVLAIPERSGRCLLLSLERPQALLEALRHPRRG